MKRLKVLISAHEFSPYQGSECSEGWNIITRLAMYHDITVLFASGSQFKNIDYVKAINEYFSNHRSIPGLELINIDQPPLTKLISKLNANFINTGSIGLPVLYFLGYNLWQRAVYKKARKLQKENNYNIVHQLTQITFREPGYLWKLGIPFIWGPTGGNSTLPKGYFNILSWKSRVFESFRAFSNYYQFNFVNRIIQANKRAALIYSFSREDAYLFEQRANCKISLMLDAGTYINTKSEDLKLERTPYITGIWCGQLIERKAPIILLRALALCKITTEKVRIKIVGSGPLETSMFQLAKKLRLENIEWIRNVPHDKIFNLFANADFMIHTSIREATSNVIPEALSMGLPVICHDINGMSIAINDSCGIKIPLISSKNSVTEFHNAICRLVTDQDLLNKLKYGAIKRVHEISWNSMTETISDDYLKIAESKKVK